MLGFDPRQLLLFDDAVVLRRDLDLAVEQGDLAGAVALLARLREQFGVEPPELALLHRLHGLSAHEALALWPEVDGASADARVRRGLVVSLLREAAPEALWRARPEALPAILEVLYSQDRRPEARRLVRDALLAGQELPLGAAGDDDALGELLAEHLSSAWLACLGAIHRLWPAPALRADELEAFAVGAPEADEARDFWTCLRAAETPGRPEAVLHEARRRMKRLRPELHARYMRRPL